MLSHFRTVLYLLLTLLLAALGLSPPAEAAEIRIELAAQADGRLAVTEHYTAAQMQRILPLYTKDGQKVLVDGIRVDGGELQKRRRQEQLQLTLTADAEQPLTLTYRYDAGADADDERDFLLFPLISAEHNGISSAEFLLTLPRGFTLARCRIISGDEHSRQNRHVEWEMTQEQFSGRLKLPLLPGEGVWLYVELPQGYWIGARRSHDLSPLLLPPAALLLLAQLALLRRRTTAEAQEHIGWGLAAAPKPAGESRAGACSRRWPHPRRTTPSLPCVRGGVSEADGGVANLTLRTNKHRPSPSLPLTRLRASLPLTREVPSLRGGGRDIKTLARCTTVDVQEHVGDGSPVPPGPTHIAHRTVSHTLSASPVPPLCEYGIIKNGEPRAEEFALQPLLWQNQGCIEICEDSCGALLLRQLQPLPPTATAAEKLLWTRLFANKQGDTAHLSFAAGELAHLLPAAARRTLQAYTTAGLLHSPRRLSALLPAAALLTALLLNFCRLRLRLMATTLLILCGCTALLLLLLGLTALLRKGSLSTAAFYLLPLPPLLLVAAYQLARYCGASAINSLLITAAALLLTVQAARLTTPTSAARSRARAQIAAEEQQLAQILQEKPPAVAKNISCYLRLLPLAICQNRADEWTELFAAAQPPGSSPSPRLQLHRARCLQQALLPALQKAEMLPHQQRRAG